MHGNEELRRIETTRIGDLILKILVIGAGGREDAIVWKLHEESAVEKIFVAPGNDGMERFLKVERVQENDNLALAQFAKDKDVDLTFVGPEAPLTNGIANIFQEKNLKIFGPCKNAAQLEGSKIFSKKFMQRYNIPTADFKVFNDFKSAQEGLAKWKVEDEGIVIKADGLAGGKGVVVTKDRTEANTTLHNFMVNEEVSIKSEQILFEKILPGHEVSAFAFCKGDQYFFLGCACDHKRVFDNDQGPNTGGMGCFRDPEWPGPQLVKKIEQCILRPTLEGCIKEGHEFCGVLFMGLMVDEREDPYVVEYNVRLGDPETQTLLPLLDGNLGASLDALIENRWEDIDLKCRDKYSVHVVATSGGYPSINKNPLSLGHAIKFSSEFKDAEIFYAGVKRENEGLVNNGGRVLGVTTIGEFREEARDKAYENIEKVNFKDMHYRTDIGLKGRGF